MVQDSSAPGQRKLVGMLSIFHRGGVVGDLLAVEIWKKSDEVGGDVAEPRKP